MAERGARYYAVRTEPQAYSTQAIQELRIQQLEQEIAVLKQRNIDLTLCLDEAVAHIHRLTSNLLFAVSWLRVVVFVKSTPQFTPRYQSVGCTE
jgi:hypothetical protein